MQSQVLAEDRRLAHGPFDHHGRRITVPFRARADFLRGQMREATVDSERIVSVVVGRAGIGESASGEESAVEGLEPSTPFGNERMGMGPTRAGNPGERFSIEGRRADIHSPGKQNREIEPATRADAGGANAVLNAIVVNETFDPGHLDRVADPSRQFATPHRPSVDFHHFAPSVSVANEPSSSARTAAARSAARRLGPTPSATTMPPTSASTRYRWPTPSVSCSTMR